MAPSLHSSLSFSTWKLELCFCELFSLHARRHAHSDFNEQEMLSELASETGAHYHSYSQSRGSDHYSVEDTEIDTVGAELSQWAANSQNPVQLDSGIVSRAEEAISELDLLQSGNISDKVLHILIQVYIYNRVHSLCFIPWSLTQLNIACCQFEDESPLCSTEDNPLPVTSREWLEKQSLEGIPTPH